VSAALDTVPSPAPQPAPRYRLEAQAHGVWWPAVTGDSRDADASLSMFATIHQAMRALDGVLAVTPAHVAVRLVAPEGRVLFLVQLGGK
jgi:hypothetical protein